MGMASGFSGNPVHKTTITDDSATTQTAEMFKYLYQTIMTFNVYLKNVCTFYIWVLCFLLLLHFVLFCFRFCLFFLCVMLFNVELPIGVYCTSEKSNNTKGGPCPVSSIIVSVISSHMDVYNCTSKMTRRPSSHSCPRTLPINIHLTVTRIIHWVVDIYTSCQIFYIYDVFHMFIVNFCDLVYFSVL